MARLASLLAAVLLLAACCALVPCAQAASGEVVVLTDANFDELVQPETGANGDWLIEFYAPWCGHCKTLEPIWNKLAASGPPFRVAKLDATSELATARRFDVRGFPSIRLLKGGRVFEHSGPRTVEGFTSFATSGTASAKGQPMPPPAGGAALALEYFNQAANDIQQIVTRKPVAGVAFLLVGALAGILMAVLAFTLCLEKPVSEYVRWTDPATGEMHTVPRYGPGQGALSPSPSASPPVHSPAAQPETRTAPATKKAQ